MVRFFTHLCAALLAFSCYLIAQTFTSPTNTKGTFQTGTFTPASCSIGAAFINTISGSMYTCTAANVWTQVPTGSGSRTGEIVMTDEVACPPSSAELNTFNGRVPYGVSGQQDAGANGGTLTVTPAGSISALTFVGTSNQATSSISAGTPAGTVTAPVFTGSALATHAHELPFQIPSTTTTRQIAAATFGVGSSRTATGVSANGSGNTSSAAVALSQAVSGGTPAGTNSVPTFTGSALGTHGHTLTPAGTIATPTFTGTPFTNAPPFHTVRFCKY